MTWFKVDDKLTFHRKVLMAGNAAMGAWVRMGSHCGAYETDGKITTEEANTIGTEQEISKLVEVGLLEQTMGGYRLHDFLVYNPAAKLLKVQRKQWVKKKRRQREMSPGDTLECPTMSPPGTPGRDRDLRSDLDPEPEIQKVSGNRARGSRLPDGWEPTAGSYEQTAKESKLSSSEVRQALVEFRDYWRGVPGQRGVKLDWDATFRNRLRDIAGKRKQSPQQNGPVYKDLTFEPGELESLRSAPKLRTNAFKLPAKQTASEQELADKVRADIERLKASGFDP